MSCGIVQLIINIGIAYNVVLLYSYSDTWHRHTMLCCYIASQTVHSIQCHVVLYRLSDTWHSIQCHGILQLLRNIDIAYNVMWFFYSQSETLAQHTMSHGIVWLVRNIGIAYNVTWYCIATQTLGIAYNVTWYCIATQTLGIAYNVIWYCIASQKH